MKGIEIKEAKRLIVSLIFLILFCPELAMGIEAQWAERAERIGTSTLRVSLANYLLTGRQQKECDDIRPKWSPNRFMVVFESIGKGRGYYQALSYININEKTPVHTIIESRDEPSADLDMFSYSTKETQRIFYAGWHTWVPGTGTTNMVIFKKGEYELNICEIFRDSQIYDIYKINLFPLLTLKKKKINDTIFLCLPGREDLLFYLKEDGRIIGTSTHLGHGEWEDVISIIGDCSANQEVVFLSTLAGSDYDLYTFKLPERGLIDLSRIKRLTFDRGVETNPKWSPDGKGIIYSSYKDNNMDIYLLPDVATETVTPIQLTTDTTTYEFNPTFSPDGKMVAYYTKANDRYDLWLMNNDGKNKKLIAENIFISEIDGPCWMPYGTSTLIYIYQTQDKMEIQDVVSGKKQEIITGDKVMSDIDCFYQGDTVFLAYSAVDENTRRKRIFIKEFDINLLSFSEKED